MKPDTNLTAAQLDTALQRARQAKDTAPGGLWLALLEATDATEESLLQALERWHGVSAITDVQWAQCTQASAEVRAITHGDAPLGYRVTVEGRTLIVAEDPWTSAATAVLARHPSAQLAIARPGQMESLHSRQVGGQGQAAVPKPSPAAQPSATGNSPVVAFVDAAIVRAYADGASDIHFETNRLGVGLKYRLDGVMVAGERLDDPAKAEEVISRIKVMAQLDITERRRPQDGRIHWQRTGHDGIDLRVSVMPSIFGEDAVLRLLDRAQLRRAEQSMSLDALGFDGKVAATIRSLGARPHGMLLITGPTGSGKTTTVYAALSEINDGLEKIITIEDPVEYELPGVLQIPVNEQKGLTFATGLRSILRHDPDKILVGEIRDAETAEIAVQSSLTGHLVMTTVHANSLFDVLGRFWHFGIEAFALASALNGVVVQRLLRKVCVHCAGSRAMTEAEGPLFESLRLDPILRLPVVVGCAQCRHTGYRGRFVVAEVHALTDEVRDLLVRDAEMSELRRTLFHDPATRLLARAIRKVGEGVTSIEEVGRVVGMA